MCAYPTVKWNNRSPIAAIWHNGSKNVVSLHTEHVSGKACAAEVLCAHSSGPGRTIKNTPGRPGVF